MISNEKFVIGKKETPSGDVNIVSSKLSLDDIAGGIKVRWGFDRMDYRVIPGLYGIGNPDENSPVFVTANYKKTFDILRKNLEGIDGWILVLDTKGVNVWCAAGKGTFGTAELVKRFFLSKVDLLVKHKTMIVPQLGAVGVSAHEVKAKTGFRIVYGPVRSEDINEFIENNMKKSADMRRVDFKMKDRLVLSPIELVSSIKFIGLLFVVSGVLSILDARTVSTRLITDYLPCLGAFLVGTVLFPVLLPYIPVRPFAIKGAILGLLYSIAVLPVTGFSLFAVISSIAVLTTIVSYLALNFTGATTFTSMIGAKLEVKYSLPVYGVLLVIGVAAKITDVVIGFLS